MIMKATLILCIAGVALLLYVSVFKSEVQDEQESRDITLSEIVQKLDNNIGVR